MVLKTKIELKIIRSKIVFSHFRSEILKNEDSFHRQESVI
jgi:hypothetical protein